MNAARMPRVLVSVRSVEEALLAAEGGADFIDLKEPAAGALGGLPVPMIRSIVGALLERGVHEQTHGGPKFAHPPRGAGGVGRRPGGVLLPISATVGDLAMDDVPLILARVAAVAACGVDYVKVGITRGPGAAPVLAALAQCAHPIVPVFIADQGLDVGLVGQACALRFPGVMADTADKRAGSLFDAVTLPDLRGFVAQVRAAGALVGLAGALRLHHVPMLQKLGPDFAGFRTAVCGADRSAALEPALLAALVAAMHGHGQPIALARA